ncbi:class I SAM-dependent methyltransferase [Sphingobium lignivorans]|uniref:Cyclopropane fatty-acyl-phospholipid synthase-like methyltransferase n=1 Tax=Sphingobium lignivorans TaxID=2735886 RepID=A0ABR6NKU3_9SPHN|nr:class I SAM-dependent methyltransferase [Sphingobium lignivorans]MBB5987277.1 cyclopropane fatty-acyl-phospholipid synthase-like methyltransferase [Sphingobium lignivorans]
MGKCSPTRAEFDRAYNDHVIGSNFLEVPEYYEIDRERYWRSLQLLCDMGLDSDMKMIEFGGGQMALLLSKMFGMDCTVADINESYRKVIDAAGLSFVIGNLTWEPPVPDADKRYDLVVMLEVIEHIPEPPYVTFRRLSSLLNPGGRVFLTTPNLFRLRNITRMVLGKDYLDRFQLPLPHVGLGHQMEYSMDHMSWQLRHAGYAVEDIRHDQLGTSGHSTKARLARRLLAPLYMRPTWREKLVAMARLSE